MVPEMVVGIEVNDPNLPQNSGTRKTSFFRSACHLCTVIRAQFVTSAMCICAPTQIQAHVDKFIVGVPVYCLGVLRNRIRE